MIEITKNLWVGNSIDGEKANVDMVLNVARDLQVVRSWPTVEYALVGLIDGPGNLLSTYYAAVIMLATFMKSGKRVLVHCHEGKSRSMVVAMMYFNLCANGQYTWEEILEIIREKVDQYIPDPHKAHKEAFDKIDWNKLTEITKE